MGKLGLGLETCNYNCCYFYKLGLRTSGSCSNMHVLHQHAYAQFRNLLVARQDPEAAWLAYRLLLAQMKTALQG